MIQLSIIIPCGDDALGLEQTLVSVLQHRPANCEVLVVNPQSYDDPYCLSDEVQFIDAQQGASLPTMLNEGVMAARGRIIHCISPGVEASENWSAPAMREFFRPDVAAVSPLILKRRHDISSQNQIRGVAAHHGERQVVHGDESGDSICGPTWLAGFYRREAVVALGGFNESLGSVHFDADLGLSLQASNYEVKYSADCPLLAGVNAVPFETEFESGMHAERFLHRHAVSISKWSRGLRLAFKCLLHPRSLSHNYGRLRGLFDEPAVDQPMIKIEPEIQRRRAA